MSINLGPGITVRIKVEGAGLPSGGEDGKILGHENGRPQWIDDKHTGIGSMLGAEYAGMLLYADEEGRLRALKLGAGLEIRDGALVATGSGTVIAQMTVDENGSATITGAEFTVDENGSATITGAEFVVDENGSAALK